MAGVALAAFSQVADVTLTVHRAGRSTGIRSDLHSSDPTAPGLKPKSASNLALTFPAGTRFNLETPLIKACILTDKQLTTAFGPSCPRRSQIGSGSAVANASPLAVRVNAEVKAYVDAPNGILLVIKPTSLPGAPTIVIRATVSGSRLTIPIPQLVLGRSKGFPGVTAVLVSLKLNVRALGSGHSALITSGRCAGREFQVRERFSYRDHSTLRLVTSSPCT